MTTPPQPPQYPGYGAPFGGPPPQGPPVPPQGSPPVPPQYGYPPQQAPYGQQQPPGAGWGPPAGPPSGGGNRAGIVIGIVAAVAVLGGGLYFVVSGSEETSGSGGTSAEEAVEEPGAYELTLPKTLEDGKFELAKDMSEQAKAQNPELGEGDDAVMGLYGSQSGAQSVLVSGGNSDNIGPDSESETGGSVLDGMEQNPSITVAVPRREITPPGAEDPLSCEVLTKSEGGQELTIKVCAWTDEGSTASLADNSPSSWKETPSQVDLEAFAARVNTMRDELRRPSDSVNS